jgi:hypothetical protein
MFASLFTAAKRTGYKFVLVVHTEPGIGNLSEKAEHYFNSKVEAKRFAKDAGLIAYNY